MYKVLWVFLCSISIVLSGCVGANVSGGAVGRHGGGFISVDQRYAPGRVQNYMPAQSVPYGYAHPQVMVRPAPHYSYGVPQPIMVPPPVVVMPYGMAPPVIMPRPRERPGPYVHRPHEHEPRHHPSHIQVPPGCVHHSGRLHCSQW